MARQASPVTRRFTWPQSFTFARFLRDLSVIAAQSKSADEALDAFAQACLALPNVDACGIFVRHDHEEGFRVSAARAADEPLTSAMAALPHCLFSSPPLVSETPVWFSEKELASSLALSKIPDCFRSALIVPVWRRGNHIASVCLASGRSRHLESVPPFLAEALSAMTAVALAARKHAGETEGSGPRLKTVLRSMRDLVFITTADGRILYANPTASRTLGHGRPDLYNLLFDQVCAQPDAAKPPVSFAELITRRDRQPPPRASLLCKEGSTLPVEIKVLRSSWDHQEAFFIACADITELHDHEQAVRQSAERFRMIVELAGVGIMIVDRTGNILFDNNASIEIIGDCGCQEEENQRRTSFVRRHCKQITHVLDTGDQLHFMTRLSVNTVPLWFDVSIRPFDKSSPRNCVLIMTRNVTDQLRALSALQESDLRFRSLTENALDLILVSSNAHKILFASNNAVSFTGYSNTELMSMSLSDIIPRQQWESVATKLHTLLDGSTPLIRHETEFFHRCGRLIPIELIVRKVEWDDHTCTMAFARDISVRRHAEATLRESEKLFRSVAERAFDAIVFINENGRFLFANRRAAEITGYRMAELTDKVFHHLIHPSDKERITRFFLNRLSGLAAPTRYETYLIKKSGTPLPIRVSIQELKIHNQRVFLHIWKDISEKKRFRDEIVKISEWEKNRIGQDLHDSIGQQLAGLGYLADALAIELQSSGSSGAEIANQISANCRTAHQQLRDIVRGLLPLGPDDSLISSLTRLASDVFSQTHAECTIKHSLDTQAMDPICASHLFHIVQEATTNAIRHGKAKHVSVVIGSEDGKGLLHIEDDGTGFDFSRTPSSGSGLKIMAFRADILRGVLTFRRKVPHGMVLRCTFDLSTCFSLPRNICDENVSLP